jgi:CRISPR-associated exonuclease Cas4
MLTWIALAFFAAALILLLVNRRHRAQGGLPTGELVYSDAAAEDTPVLVSYRYGLKGKPDALVRISSGDVIPVERKKSRAPKRPYDGDLIQAAAYCLLVEEHYGRTPPFMRIQYSDRWFDQPYTGAHRD